MSGQPVMTKGRAAHIVCSLARTQATYCVPQTVIVGMAPPRADEEAP